MVWVTLALRKKELKAEHSSYQLRDLQISRQKRQLARRKMYEQAVIKKNQKEALAPIKLNYDKTLAELNRQRDMLNRYLAVAKKVAGGEYKDDNALKITSDGVYQESSNGLYVYSVFPNGDVSGFRTQNQLPNHKIENGKAFYIKDGNNNDTTYCFKKNENGNIQFFEKIVDFSALGTMVPDIDLSSVTKDDISGLETSINAQIQTIQNSIQQAQTDYLEQQNDKKTFFEDELEMLEQEVADEEVMLEEEQVEIETQMEAISQEMQAVTEAVSQQIQNGVIRLS